MYRAIQAAALSLRPKKWDKPSNADKLEMFVRRAAQRGAELVVAPEGFLEGYVVMDAIYHHERRPDMWEIAEPMDGPYVQRFRAIADELGIVLCFGFAERRDTGIYNTAVVLGPSGQICGTYQKVLLAEGTAPNWDFNRVGQSLRAIDTSLGRVGIMICNDRWNPDVARTQVMDGAQILLIPAYGSRRRHQNEAVIARARENGVPIVEANVGVNLIVSKGEVVAYAWGNDRISLAEIEAPLPPSSKRARSMEEAFLTWQEPEMQRRHEKTVEHSSSETAI